MNASPIPFERNAALFDQIYQERVWDEGGTAPLSGKGSTVKNSLPVLEWIRKLQPSSVLDIGCGDLTWMNTAIQEHHFSYTGVDVSHQAIIHARKRLDEPSLRAATFIRADFTQPAFRAHADLVIVKDVFFHLTDAQIVQALCNLARSTYRHLIVNTDDVSYSFVDGTRRMNSAHWAMANLEKAPFGGSLGACGRIVERKPRPEHGEYLLIQAF